MKPFRLAMRLIASLITVGLATFIGSSLVPLNATSIGFIYVLIVLVFASLWGFVEAAAASIAATLTFNFYFLPPVGKLTIADPQNWVALFSFLVTSLIASRLSTLAKRRELDAVARGQDLERLYTFSRSILLIHETKDFPKELIKQVADIFKFEAAILYDRRSDEFHRAGPGEFDGMDDQLRDAALQGSSYSDVERSRTITAIRLGSQPIAGLALQGSHLPDSVLQGIANLVAIGLERARAQGLAAQVEAAEKSEKLRTTLLDAMAHEFKTPLTAVLGATSALNAELDQSREVRAELVRIADEEAKHLKELIDDTVEMGRLDSPKIELHAEASDIMDILNELLTAMKPELDDRNVRIEADDSLPVIYADRRLIRLAIKQLVDNANKYSPSHEAICVRIRTVDDKLQIVVSDRGKGIPQHEQQKVFDRLYRSPSVEHQIPGSGLGLSIAKNIAVAHQGDLTVSSHPGGTTFTLELPLASPK